MNYLGEESFFTKLVFIIVIIFILLTYSKSKSITNSKKEDFYDIEYNTIFDLLKTQNVDLNINSDMDKLDLIKKFNSIKKNQINNELNSTVLDRIIDLNQQSIDFL